MQMIIQYLPGVMYLAITIMIGFFNALAHDCYKRHKEFLDNKCEQLIQKIGIDEYNHNIKIAKGIINSFEEQARNFNWEGAIKHAKLAEQISNKTGLTDDQIFDVIKATVNEWNANKPAATI